MGAMTAQPGDLNRFKYTLPYASEAFGLYQPLMGWRAQRALARTADGLGVVDRDVFTSVSRLIGADVRASADHEVEALRTGAPVMPSGHHPAIDSVIADRISAKLRGSDLESPKTWSGLLSRENLDSLLEDEV